MVGSGRAVSGLRSGADVTGLACLGGSFVPSLTQGGAHAVSNFLPLCTLSWMCGVTTSDDKRPHCGAHHMSLLPRGYRRWPEANSALSRLKQGFDSPKERQ